jgi:hypothetical protein
MEMGTDFRRSDLPARGEALPMLRDHIWIILKILLLGSGLVGAFALLFWLRFWVWYGR